MWFPGKNMQWAAISFPGGSSWCKDWTLVSCIVNRLFTPEPPLKPCICIYINIYMCVCVCIMYIGNTLSPPFWWVLHLQIQPTASRILCLWSAVHWIPRCRNLEKPRTEWGIWATSVFWYRGVCSGTSSLEILREDCIRHLCLQIATFYPCLFPCWIITVENPWWEFTNV